MGQPITWQNVNQGDVSSAWRGLDTAGKSINGAFDGLQGLVKGAESVQAGNDVAIKNNNTQDYLNKLTGMFKSPEDLAAGLTDGRVDQLKAAYGNAINHDQVRGAAEALLKTRQDQTVAGQVFSNSSTDFKQQGTVDSIMAKINSGDPLQVAAGKAEFDAHPELRNKAAIAQAANGAGYQLVTRDREAKKFTDDMLTSKTNREVAVKNADSSRISANASVMSAQAAQSNAKTARDSLTASLMEKSQEMVLKAGTGMATLNSHLANSPEGKDTINKAIAGIKDDDARAAAARVVQKLPPDAKAGDVANLVQTIIKPGFWGTIFGKNTPDDEVVKSFETVYNANKDTDATKQNLAARKALLNSVAAQGTDNAQMYGGLLNRSLGLPGAPAAVAAPVPARGVPAPVVPAAPVATPAAVAQAESLRAMIPAPGAPGSGPRIDTGVPLFGSDGPKVGEISSFNKAMQTRIAAEAALARKAEADGKAAKAAQHKAAIQALLKQGLQRPDTGYSD